MANGVGIALAGTILPALFSGSITSSTWSAHQVAQFEAGEGICPADYRLVRLH